MDNKKQLVIVPPMSEPLQKLNEVLNGIATDENIEISIIDDYKELSQFIGSAGQCLMAFSNAKKCATFLQENRFALAKTHSKVILLTPKEIPAKTLIKFTKIGLTESILETAPPKTLLYKVKLLLRSIKSTSIQQEEKDHVVKSMLDTNQPTTTKGEMNTEGIEGEEATVNYMAEERAKFKGAQDENSINYGENLKGKTSVQEEAIETHWKSKRKKGEVTLDLDSTAQEAEETNANDIDMYYRGKKKSNSIDSLEQEDLYAKSVTTDSEEAVEDFLKKKRVEETELNLEKGKKERRADSEEENTGYSLKKINEYDILSEEQNSEEKKTYQREEDPEETKKKELDELEALFEEAKKRQKEQEVEDLGGHYKGKINNNSLDLEEEDELTEEKEYDNSELTSNQKSVELDLIEGTDDRKKQQSETEEEQEKRKSAQEKLDSNMTGEDGSSDRIDTLMMSDIGEDSSKKLRTIDIFEQDTNKKKNSEEEDSSSERKKDNETELATDAENIQKKKQSEEMEDGHKDKIRLDEDFDDSLAASSKKDEEEEQDSDEDIDHAKVTNLKLIDGDAVANKNKNENHGDLMSYRKINQTDLGLEKGKDNQNGNGKVDKIDTYYRTGEGKKTEHSWDNLTDKNRDIELALAKGAKKNDENMSRAASKDAGEITIDYRKLKEEFDAIARGEEQGEEDGIYSKRGAHKSEEDEDGSFKVVELDARGFDFGIEIINLIYQKESKPIDFYRTITEELVSRYKAYPVFYNYKPSEKKHLEAFDCFMQITTPQLSDELRNWWEAHKKEESVMADYFAKTMATWVCREIQNKNTEGKYWEDVELPSWAANELTDKKVELIFPYFDGVDRMGVALIFFPFGLNPKLEKGIEVTLEMVRTVLLDSIQRKTASTEKVEEITETDKTEKKKILNMFSGIFKGNKAG